MCQPNANAYAFVSFLRSIGNFTSSIYSTFYCFRLVHIVMSSIEEKLSYTTVVTSQIVTYL